MKLIFPRELAFIHTRVAPFLLAMEHFQIGTDILLLKAVKATNLKTISVLSKQNLL